MISHTRCVAFLCVPGYLLATDDARSLDEGAEHECGRGLVRRVGAVVPRLPPGAPPAAAETALAPPAVIDGTECAFPVRPGRRMGRDAPFSSVCTQPAISAGRARGMHQAMLGICRAVAPEVEEVALGAAYADFSGSELMYRVPARQMAQDLVHRVTWELGLPWLAGLARNKVLAHLAARHAQPGQVFELRQDQERLFLDAEPLGALPGIGSTAVTLLRDYGVWTVGDFGRLPDVLAVHLLGSRARRLLAWARGEDSRPVRGADRSAVEQSAAVTFPRVTLDYAVIVEAAQRLVDQLLFGIRRQSRQARVVSVRVTYSDLREAHILRPLRQSTSLYPEVHRAVEDLLRCVLARRVRVGRLEVGLGRFVADQRQLSLFPDRRDRLAQLCRSVDQVWSKYGRVVLFGDAPSLRSR